MPKQTAPGLGLGYGWNLGESGPAVKEGMDDNFLTTSVLVNLSVKSRVTALPASAPNGDRYIVPAGGANAHAVAARVGGAWKFFAPKRNWEARVEDEDDAKVRFTGTAWEEVTEGGGGGDTRAPAPTPAASMAVATLTGIVQTPADTAADKDFLTLTIPAADLHAGLALEVLFFGTQNQAAAAQNLIFYVKVNDGAPVTVGQVGAGSSVQNYRAIRGAALLTLLSTGASGSYSLGGEMMINGLVPYSSTSGSARPVNTTTELKLTVGIRNSVANEANFENIVSAYIKQIS